VTRAGLTEDRRTPRESRRDRRRGAWPAIIDRATHDRLVGLLEDPSQRRESFGWPHVLRRSGSSTAVMRREVDDIDRADTGSRLRLPQGREPSVSYPESASSRSRSRPCGGLRHRRVAESPEALNIEQSDSDRMARIRKITDEMRHLQEQKNKALRMKLRREVSRA
jgi:hypothetical protein